MNYKLYNTLTNTNTLSLYSLLIIGLFTEYEYTQSTEMLLYAWLPQIDTNARTHVAMYIVNF